jgi:elongation factor P--(R)-beta-lysine ligase
MKRLLAAGHGPIYQITKVFRDAERGRHHNVEFTMLEWYQPGFDHIQLMHQVSELLMLTLKVEQCEYKSYQNLFEDAFSINPHKTSATELKLIAIDHDIHINTDSTEKDFWLDLLMTHIIEPTLGQNYPIFIYDYPESQAALAKIRQGESPVAERFEVYYRGIELANGFHELLDAHEQLARFKKNLFDRKRQSKQEIPIDENFIAALSHGLPNCAGVALGIDRLCMLAIGAKSISEIISFANE